MVELLVILLLVLVNGFFALSEIALVSVQRSAIEARVEKGDRRARTVSRLLSRPATFLSAIQTGITLIGIVAGAFGGATLAAPLGEWLAQWPVIAPRAYGVALLLVVGGITYFTIVVGELVPKTIAMSHPERVALFAAPIISVFARVMYPFVRLLSYSTAAVMKLIPIEERLEPLLSDEDLRSVIRTGNMRKVLERQEADARQNLLRFGEHYAHTLMTPRERVQWLDGSRPIAELVEQARMGARSKYPICDGDIDRVMGTLRTRDLLEHYQDADFSLEREIQPAITIPENTPAYAILHIFKRDRQHIAMVADKDGRTLGVVTLLDLTEAILGDLPEFDEEHPEFMVRADGSFLVSGNMLIEHLNERLGATIMDASDTGCTTVAEYFLVKLQHKPAEGARIQERRFHGEVLDMDGRRIDKVLITLK
jgi:putative hemolysin